MDPVRFQDTTARAPAVCRSVAPVVNHCLDIQPERFAPRNDLRPGNDNDGMRSTLLCNRRRTQGDQRGGYNESHANHDAAISGDDTMHYMAKCCLIGGLSLNETPS